MSWPTGKGNWKSGKSVNKEGIVMSYLRGKNGNWSGVHDMT